MRRIALTLCCIGTMFVSRAYGAADPFEQLRSRVRRFSLSNGMRVIFVQKDEAPIFSGQIWVKVGGVDELPGSTGIAHFLEHMAFKGTESIGTKDFAREKPLLDRLDEIVESDPEKRVPDNDETRKILAELETYWVDNEYGRTYTENGGTQLNAATAKDYTHYEVSLPKEALDLWFQMESDRMFHPVFRQFYKEREVVQEERRGSSEDDPLGTMYETLLQVAYLVHPNRLPVIGFSDDLKRATRPQMEMFYRTYYRPDNMVVVLVGDLDEGRVRTLSEKYFGVIPAQKGAIPTIHLVEPRQAGEREARVAFDAQPRLMIGYHKPVYPNPDDARFALVHSILTDGRSGVMYRELVERKKIVSSIQSDEGPGERYPSLFILSATPKLPVEKVRDEIQGLLDSFARKPIEPDVLAAAKKRTQVGLLKLLDSPSDLASDLGKSELLWNDWEATFKVYRTVDESTADEVRGVVAKYLTPTNRTTVILEPKSESNPKTVSNGVKQ